MGHRKDRAHKSSKPPNSIWRTRGSVLLEKTILKNMTPQNTASSAGQTIFGMIPIAPQDLVQALNDYSESCETGLESQSLFECLERVGKCSVPDSETDVVDEHGRRAFYLDRKKNHRAFLIDFMWWQQGFGTLLAAESELSAGIHDMKHDFEKLLCWKAPLKVMIVRESGQLPANEIAAELSRYALNNVQQYIPGEHFVLFVFGEERNHAFLHIASGKPGDDFRFEELAIPGKQAVA